MSKPSKKPMTDNRSTIIKGQIKLETPNFPGNKSAPNFKPGARFQSINRGRR